MNNTIILRKNPENLSLQVPLVYVLIEGAVSKASVVNE